MPVSRLALCQSHRRLHLYPRPPRRRPCPPHQQHRPIRPTRPMASSGPPAMTTSRSHPSPAPRAGDWFALRPVPVNAAAEDVLAAFEAFAFSSADDEVKAETVAERLPGMAIRMTCPLGQWLHRRRLLRPAGGFRPFGHSGPARPCARRCGREAARLQRDFDQAARPPRTRGRPQARPCPAATGLRKSLGGTGHHARDLRAAQHHAQVVVKRKWEMGEGIVGFELEGATSICPPSSPAPISTCTCPMGWCGNIRSPMGRANC